MRMVVYLTAVGPEIVSKTETRMFRNSTLHTFVNDIFNIFSNNGCHTDSITKINYVKTGYL